MTETRRKPRLYVSHIKHMYLMILQMASREKNMKQGTFMSLLNQILAPMAK